MAEQKSAQTLEGLEGMILDAFNDVLQDAFKDDTYKKDRAIYLARDLRAAHYVQLAANPDGTPDQTLPWKPQARNQRIIDAMLTPSPDGHGGFTKWAKVKTEGTLEAAAGEKKE